MSHFEPIFGMIDPQWLICLGLGDKKTTWGSGLASCSESLFTRHQKIHWGLGDMFVAKKNCRRSWWLIIHTAAFLSLFGCVKSSVQDLEGEYFMELPTLWLWRLAEQRSHRQTDRTSPDLRPRIFWWDTLFLQPPLKIKSTAGPRMSKTFDATRSIHHDQQSRFKKDSRKFGPNVM